MATPPPGPNAARINGLGEVLHFVAVTLAILGVIGALLTARVPSPYGLDDEFSFLLFVAYAAGVLVTSLVIFAVGTALTALSWLVTQAAPVQPASAPRGVDPS